MIGLAISNYPSSTTTVTTTPLVFPIPGPMPYSCKFAKVDISYVRFHMEATPLQGQSLPPPNPHSLPTLSDRIHKISFRMHSFMARSHTGMEYTHSILPGRTLSGTATTTP